MLNGEANADEAPAEERDKDRITVGPRAVRGKPGAAAATPNPPAPEPNGGRPDPNAFNLIQGHVLNAPGYSPLLLRFAILKVVEHLFAIGSGKGKSDAFRQPSTKKESTHMEENVKSVLYSRETAAAVVADQPFVES
jgi:hypothetical protein